MAKAKGLVSTAAPTGGRGMRAPRKRAGVTPVQQPLVPENPTGGIDLEQYVPAYLTFTATKLASGAAAVYRKYYGVGIEVWRVLVMLALEEKVSVNMVCKLIGMDKGSVSRCFKTMYEKGFITFSVDPDDGRVRYATLTPAGRAKHDEIKAVALERQRVLLSCLSDAEAQTFMGLLLRVHANLPNVEKATQAYIKEKGPKAITST